LILKLRSAFLTTLIFGAAHYLVAVLASAAGVFLLDWWEPKWGSRFGSWMMDVTTFVPLMTCVSMVGGLVAILLAWRNLRGFSRAHLATLASIAGCVTAGVGYGLSYISQQVSHGRADWMQAAAQGWLLLGSLVVWLVIALTVSRRPGPERAA
jgi:hypothetical protein